MARKMTGWAAKRAPTTKIMLSDGYGGDTDPVAVER